MEAEENRQRQRAERKAAKEKAKGNCTDTQEQRPPTDTSAPCAAFHLSAEDRIKQLIVQYDRCWGLLVKGTNLPSETKAELLPWPLLKPPQTADCFNTEAIRAFMFHPLRGGSHLKGEELLKFKRARVKEELLRWHPDKFRSIVLKRINESQKHMTEKCADIVARALIDFRKELDA